MWHEILLSLFGSGFMTLAAVILTAWLSYEFLEKPVLRYKRRWSRVESRPV
jgi:peptidoglycan/LPS O-acetylase OafA/YrhL